MTGPFETFVNFFPVALKGIAFSFGLNDSASKKFRDVLFFFGEAGDLGAGVGFFLGVDLGLETGGFFDGGFLRGRGPVFFAIHFLSPL
jgi:hypothetical protein